MPYTARFYLYLLVASTIVVIIADQIRSFGLAVTIGFAVAAGYLAIIIGRRLLGRKNL